MHSNLVLHLFDYINAVILTYFVIANVMYSILMMISLYAVSVHSKFAAHTSYEDIMDSPVTPPVALLTDANIMSSSVDRIILVVKASTTPYDAIQKAIENVGRERIIGVVLNAAPDVLEYGPDYLSYYAASGTTTSG